MEQLEDIKLEDVFLSVFFSTIAGIAFAIIQTEVFGILSMFIGYAISAFAGIIFYEKIFAKWRKEEKKVK